MAGFRLRQEGQRVGALNVFSDTAGALTEHSLDQAIMLTAFASVTLAALERGEEATTLRRGLESNREIGKAVGLLMAMHDIDDDRAFEMLAKVSQEMNVKVAEVAAQVVAHHRARRADRAAARTRSTSWSRVSSSRAAGYTWARRSRHRPFATVRRTPLGPLGHAPRGPMRPPHDRDSQAPHSAETCVAPAAPFRRRSTGAAQTSPRPADPRQICLAPSARGRIDRMRPTVVRRSAASAVAVLLPAGLRGALRLQPPRLGGPDAETAMDDARQGDGRRATSRASTSRAARPGRSRRPRRTPTITGGIRGDSEAKVSVGRVSTDGDSATGQLDWSWQVGSKTWSYDTTVRLTKGTTSDGDAWLVRWEPTLVEPSLKDGERLVETTVQAERGRILGADGPAARRPATGAARRARQDRAHRGPGRRLRAPPRRAAGHRRQGLPQAGQRVRAQGLRGGHRLPPAGRPGRGAGRALRHQGGRCGRPARSRSRPPRTSPPRSSAPSARRPPSWSRTARGGSSRATTSGSPACRRGTTSSCPAPAAPPSSAVDDEAQRRTLFTADPEPGSSLHTTIDLKAQNAAQRALADVGPASALVAIRPSTGDLVAVASGPGSKGYNTATYGRYAPGSTFKVVSALALLRAGLTPQTRVDCPPTTVVDGKTFKNYDDYPSSGFGSITFEDALANSCNTAFIGQRDKLGPTSLAEAAAALGFGVDHDTGFPTFFGEVGHAGQRDPGGGQHDRPGHRARLADGDGHRGGLGAQGLGRAARRLLPDVEVQTEQPAKPLTADGGAASCAR